MFSQKEINPKNSASGWIMEALLSPVKNSKDVSDFGTALDGVSHWGRKQGKILTSEIHSFSFKEWKLLLRGRYFLNNYTFIGQLGKLRN